ncbi:hypothetical protein JB92DRAFT_2917792 [Gautieria morchelliformis]|nr:hypothetical protein JB92DRAFT_2917792 [Gautieria morchelliformis]
MASMRELISPEFKPYLVGSYRRGQPTSSDIDILLFHPSYTKVPTFASTDTTESRLRHRSTKALAHPPPTLLQDYIAPLMQKGLIASALGGGASRWQGLVKIQLENEEVIRRVDIFLMPQLSEASGLLAFTGDTQFNVDCRNRAKRRGMHLNEFGLWRPKLSDVETGSNGREDDWDGGQGQECGRGSEDDRTQWELVKTPDEAALLRELGMGYIVPERRNLANIYPREKATKAEGTKLRRSHRDHARNNTPHSKSDNSKFLSSDRERSQLQKSSTHRPRSSQARSSR